MIDYLMIGLLIVVFFLCLYGGGVLFIRGIASVLFDVAVMVATKDIDEMIVSKKEKEGEPLA